MHASMFTRLQVHKAEEQARMEAERTGALLRSQGQELEEKTRRNTELEEQVRNIHAMTGDAGQHS